MLLTAHSGSDDTEENSLSFVEKMIEGQVDCVEVDVRKSQKGQLYLSHDQVDSFRDVRNIFMLDELFQYLSDRQRQTKINCDLKEPDLEAEVKWLAERWGIYDQIIFSGTVDPAHLSAWDREKVYYNIENCLPNIYPVGCLKKAHFDVLHYMCRKYGMHTLNLHYKFCTDEWIDWCHSNNLQISVWTVNDRETIEEFKDKGVHNITTRRALNYLTQVHSLEKV